MLARRNITIKLIYILSICFGFFLISLSVWQLNRGLTKAATLSNYSEQTEYQLTEVAGQRVTLVGSYLPINIYLENQSDGNMRGFSVFAPFKTEHGIVLVNRGFSPTAVGISSKHEVTGTIEEPAFNSWITKPFNKEFLDGFSVLHIDIKAIEDRLGIELYTKVIKDLEVEAEFTYISPSTYLSPERHYGYSLQWITCALVYFILLWRVRRTNESL